MIKNFLFLHLLLLSTLSVSAQSPQTLAIRQHTTRQADAIVHEYAQFLSLPNIASDTANIRKNTAFIMDMMSKRGIGQVQLLSAATPGVPPAVYGEVLVPGARQTIIFYAHYDGQPVNPAQWSAGLHPFEPKLYTAPLDQNGAAIPLPADGKYSPDWRLYARSASDDKAGVDAILNAYDALKKSGLQPGSNIKFFFEGEEEAGSPHLGEILEKYHSLLQSDLWIICDGPVHQTGKKQIVFGVRGDTHLDLTCMHPNAPCTAGIMATGLPTRP